MRNTLFYIPFLFLTACVSHYEGKVTNKTYIASTTGTGVSSSGKFVVTSTIPQWVIELDNGNHEVSVDKQVYLMVKIGDSVSIDVHPIAQDTVVIK